MAKLLSILCAALFTGPLLAHSGHDELPLDDVHPLKQNSRLRVIESDQPLPANPGFLAMALPAQLTTAKDSNADGQMPEIAKAFEPLVRAKEVKTRWDDRWFYVESNGMPNHPMMIGITAWQQQVPLPQPYTGNNAWQIPLNPTPAKNPVSIKGKFLRGAIALAANGIPIFNPQNNRGEVSAEIGELDEYGGHCGRADDYHYHAAPLHLQDVVGKDKPIAWALDGYPIYGLLEPDGTKPANLDAFNGHTTAGLGYHYHASKKYPYVNGGFHGEVTERGGQVDPQSRAFPVRQDGRPLRGAKITDFKIVKPNSYSLTYTVNNSQYKINYSVNEDGSYPFEFVDPSGQSTKETYRRRAGGGGDGGGGGQGGGGPGGGNGGDRPPRPDRGGGAERPPRDNPPPPDRQQQSPPRANLNSPETPAGGNDILKPLDKFVLTSPEVKEGGALPKEFTGDGAASTLPLEWSGAPAQTKSFALVMHHIDPEGKAKWYWIIYNIPADTHALAKNVKDVGTLGNNGINGRLGYAPPHSKGPGVKKYTLTLYALSEAPKLNVRPAEVSREVLLAAIKDSVLATAQLNVTYERSGATDARPDGPRRAN